MHMQPANAVISDACADLLNVYRQVVADPDTLADELAHIGKLHVENGYDGGSELYYRIREEFNSRPPEDRMSGKHALYFIYLLCKCYNALCRYNSKGGFNAPLHKISHMTRPVPSKDHLKEVAAYLHGQVIADHRGWPSGKTDFTSWLARYREDICPGDFVMIDPPYFPYWEQGFTTYSNGGFDDAAQYALRDALDEFWQKGIMVMAWNSAVPKAIDAYSNWPTRTVSVKNCVGNKSYEGKKKDRFELCMTNYDPATCEVLPYVGRSALT